MNSDSKITNKKSVHKKSKNGSWIETLKFIVGSGGLVLIIINLFPILRDVFKSSETRVFIQTPEVIPIFRNDSFQQLVKYQLTNAGKNWAESCIVTLTSQGVNNNSIIMKSESNNIAPEESHFDSITIPNYRNHTTSLDSIIIEVMCKNCELPDKVSRAIHYVDESLYPDTSKKNMTTDRVPKTRKTPTKVKIIIDTPIEYVIGHWYFITGEKHTFLTINKDSAGYFATLIYDGVSCKGKGLYQPEKKAIHFEIDRETTNIRPTCTTTMTWDVAPKTKNELMLVQETFKNICDVNVGRDTLSIPRISNSK